MTETERRRIVSLLRSGLLAGEQRRLCNNAEVNSECTAPPSSIDVTNPTSLSSGFAHCLTSYGCHRTSSSPTLACRAMTGSSWRKKSGIPHRRLKPLIDTCPAATKDKPAHPHAPRNLTLAVNLQGAILTATVAQEY